MECECIMAMVMHAQEVASEVADSEKRRLAATQQNEEVARQQREQKQADAEAAARSRLQSIVPILGRRLIYSHHIINETKRHNVIHWAAELRLGG
jgi:hypothetical protein